MAVESAVTKQGMTVTASSVSGFDFDEVIHTFVHVDELESIHLSVCINLISIYFYLF